ncbi:MAG: protein tyrosine phosphatase family protein [Planctomycetota bacterium]|jgi:uncharacterized protein (TIGR01244 family)
MKRPRALCQALATGAVLVFLASCDDAAPNAVEPVATVIPDRVEPFVCGSMTLQSFRDVRMGGQPGLEDLEQAKSDGTVTVINLRKPDELADFDEAQAAEELGLVYHGVPWRAPDEMTDAVLDELRGLLRDAERPILLHCGSGNRVGAVWIVYRVLDDGIDVEAAVDEARTIGLKSAALEEKARDYIARSRGG